MERGAGVGEVVVDVVAVADALVSPGSVGVEGPVAAGQLVAIDHDPHQGDARAGQRGGRSRSGISSAWARVPWRSERMG